jgi:hypothetical protein
VWDGVSWALGPESGDNKVFEVESLYQI